ncbi:glyoxalase/bleomycin resistance/dioxygenase family protein [Nonomuraea sp. SYSU D8015]|uniref:glyoxalase/bleomycin resistance/dioxygenase family protein n=1 Tax=Nonomuraea sp. SYSU D8015 TaxID=2593644 RepID=UPI00166020AF|nr:glyoxalase/bleomycin resistance/dioxygenase family protein [Nonomuraea sp. SYSU D8015]
MHPSLIVLYTDHLQECALFYISLGLPLQAEQHGNGPKHYAAELGATVFEVYPASDRRPPTGSLRLGFRVPAHAVVRRLPPGRHLLTDPDGRTVDLEIMNE